MSAAVKQAVADLTSEKFAQRQEAEKQLIAQGPPVFEPLMALLESVPPEAGQRLLVILEQIWLQTPEPQSDILERQFEALRLTFGSYQPAVEHLLFAHHRLREERAVRALRRLNAVVETEDDLEAMELLINQGLPLPKVPPKHIAQIILPRTWKGAESDLWQIQRLSHLGSLTVFVVEGNGISESAKLQMQIGFPDIRVMERAGVYLGVVGSQFGNQLGCSVSMVQSGSPAETAGLRSGDTILSVDGKKINSFTGLVEALKSKRPYEPIELEVDPGYGSRFPRYPFEKGGKSDPNILTAIGLPWEARRFPTPPPPPLTELLPDPQFPETLVLPGNMEGLR